MVENIVMQSVDQWLARTETWLYEQVKRLPETVQSHVLCNTTCNLERFPWPRVHAMENGGAMQRFIRKTCERLDIDRRRQRVAHLSEKIGARVMHSHFGNIGWRDVPAARAAGMRHMVTFYGHDVVFIPQQFPKWRERYREMFDAVDRVLCEGPHMAACVEELGCPREKLRVHHLGVALDKIEYRPRQWEAGEPLCVLLAATFHEKKGIPFAIRALGELNRKTPLRITLIGDENPNSGIRSDKTNILRAIEECGLKIATRMLGFQPHDVLLREAYANHIYMAPSVTASNGDTEGGAPVSLIEMIATGMPAVASRHCDIPNVVIDRKTGLLADERDVDGLCECLDWLVSHREEWTKLTLAGRHRIESEFDSRIQGRRLAAIYQEAMAA
jgi:colanic acid/amylovoran biosynthesis glycosyltransferase